MRQDVKELTPYYWNNVVFDEAHRLKGRNTLTSKAAILIARRCVQMALLTGTPIMNRAEELWSLLRLLDPDEYRSYWRWCHKYFNTETRHFQKSPRPVEIVVSQKTEMLPELREEVACTLIQRPMKDLLPDLPDVVVDMIPVRLTPAERKVYDQLEKHSWAQSEDGDILQVSNEVSKIARQRQLSSDFSSLFDGGAPASKAKAAIEVIKDLVEEGEQVVVMCAFKHTACTIIEGVGAANALPYNGDIPSWERENYLEAFTNGAVSVLCGTQATMGEGVDGLQCARHLVMVDRDWTPARNQQAVGRLQRSGQKDTVIVHHLYCEGTIDETVARVCEEKEQVIEMILG
jgi:SNF2 family DNA or RNA helicase